MATSIAILRLQATALLIGITGFVATAQATYVERTDTKTRNPSGWFDAGYSHYYTTSFSHLGTSKTVSATHETSLSGRAFKKTYNELLGSYGFADVFGDKNRPDRWCMSYIKVNGNLLDNDFEMKVDVAAYDNVDTRDTCQTDISMSSKKLFGVGGNFSLLGVDVELSGNVYVSASGYAKGANREYITNDTPGTKYFSAVSEASIGGKCYVKLSAGALGVSIDSSVTLFDTEINPTFTARHWYFPAWGSGKQSRYELTGATPFHIKGGNGDVGVSILGVGATSLDWGSVLNYERDLTPVTTVTQSFDSTW